MEKTILLVEDEEIIRKVYAEELGDRGFTVITAKNGKEGVKLALARHPDFILLDLLMPVMDGMTALKNIRQDTWGSQVPVIILTNLNPKDENTIKDTLTNKPLHYLIKSDWNIEDVIEKIKNALHI
jgi:CheY-like chemotaxis protein